MATDRDPPADDPDIMAAELAIGLLDGEDRAIALRRVLSEPDFARRVDAWRERLSPFDAAMPEVDTPDRVWRAIDRRLNGERGALVRWRAATAATTALAAALMAALLLRAPANVPATPAAPPAPQFIAQLGAPEVTAMLAVYQDRSGNLIVRPAVVNASKRDVELWIIPKDGKPVSLGLIARDRPSRVALGDKRSLFKLGAILAVSLEPIGGSPTGQPTGPVVATGAISPL